MDKEMILIIGIPILILLYDLIATRVVTKRKELREMRHQIIKNEVEIDTLKIKNIAGWEVDVETEFDREEYHISKGGSSYVFKVTILIDCKKEESANKLFPILYKAFCKEYYLFLDLSQILLEKK